jgi:hypothetical protein
MTKKRGAQPGNTNALRHGYHSHRFKPTQLADLEVQFGEDLSNEIFAVRVAISDLIIMAGKHDKTKPDLIGTLDTLSGASIRLATLLRTQDALKNRTNDILTILNGVLTEALDELGFKSPAGMARSDLK